MCSGMRKTVCLIPLFLTGCVFLNFGEAYVVDDSGGLGPKFDGIGGLSGGGVRSHFQ